MKKVFLFATIAALSLGACKQKTETTKLSGVLGEDAPTAVQIQIPDLKIDTTIAVADGNFEVDLPVDAKTLGRIAIGDRIAQFVPDGSALKIDASALEGDKLVEVASDNPNSVQSKYNAMNEWLNKFFDSYYAKMNSGTMPSEEEQDAIVKEYVDYLKGIVKDNKDNALAVAAVEGLRGQIEPSEMEEVLSSLSPALDEVSAIADTKTLLKAQKATAAGQKFIDFEATQPDGSIKKLSDYVGKGKYVLVDFWASWCGPCKREIPNIKDTYNKLKGDKFNVLSVAVWDKPEDTVKAAVEHGVVWDQIINAGQTPTDLYGIEGIPHLILFGPDGSIVARGESLRGEDMAQTIASYIK